MKLRQVALIPVEAYLRSLPIAKRKRSVTNNPFAQAVSFNQMIVIVFNDLLEAQLVGLGSRRGSRNGESPLIIHGVFLAVLMQPILQPKPKGMMVYLVMPWCFGALITPGKSAAVANKEMEREKLLTRVPRISAVWMNEVTKRAIPSHWKKNKDGVHGLG